MKRVVVWILLAALSPALAEGSADTFSGAWSGTFAIHFDDGRVANDTAWFVLKQTGEAVTGTAGPKADQQKPIRDGVATGSELKFVADSANGKTLQFTLRREGARLSGEAGGEIGDDHVRVVVSVTRVGVTESTTTPKNPLFEEIAALDAKLFDAYNRRDLAGVMAMFTRDLEFYHDGGGLTLYAENERNFRGKFAEPARYRRELAEGTLEVYPIADYGAVEIGTHRFYSTAPGEPEKLGATARFTHVWQHSGGQWRIRRVISYDHR